LSKIKFKVDSSAVVTLILYTIQILLKTIQMPIY
jgi:hypothetical protein